MAYILIPVALIFVGLLYTLAAPKPEPVRIPVRARVPRRRTTR